MIKRNQIKLWEAFWIKAPFAALIFYLIQVLSGFFMRKAGVADKSINTISIVIMCVSLLVYSFIILRYSNNTKHKVYTWLARLFVFFQITLFLFILIKTW